MSITASTSTTCPTWCEQHTTEEGITYHEANVIGDGWDLILTHDDTEGSSVSAGLKRDPLPPSEAFALGVALIEAATTIGQVEAEQETPATDTSAPFASVLASELRRGGWNLSILSPGDDLRQTDPTFDDERPVQRYSTRTEAIAREIIEPLLEYRHDHDVEAIAREVLGDYSQGYACMVDAPTFWAIVERHASITVPTTERVRRTYAYGEDSTLEGFKAAGEAFDAWLAAHDAELLASSRTAGA